MLRNLYYSPAPNFKIVTLQESIPTLVRFKILQRA